MRLPRPTLVVAGTFFALVMAFSGRYGFHRDELYFLAAGRHLAAGYPDQGPLVPLLARVFGHSLWLLRLPAALAATGTVLLAATIARDLGGSQRAQTLAAMLTTVCGVVLGTAHLFSTTTFDLTLQTAMLLVVLRLLREPTARRWIALGLIVGLDLLIKDLAPFTLVGLLAGVVALGPRSLLRSPWLLASAVLALAIASPAIAWQAQHGWPQLDISSSISHGGSDSSVSRGMFVPTFLLQMSPPLVPVFVVGMRRLVLDRSPMAVGFAVTFVLFIATGGKPYYVAAYLPVAFAASAPALLEWVERGRRRWPVALLAVNAAVTAAISLPIVPVSVLSDTPIPSIDADSAETVGWPAFARTVSGVLATRSGPTVVLTDNYGEAGALQRYGVPDVYSGHNAFWLWGPPPDAVTSAIVVGLDDAERSRLFEHCQQDATIDDHVGVDNDEQGTAVWACSGMARPWSQVWRSVRRYG